MLHLGGGWGRAIEASQQKRGWGAGGGGGPEPADDQGIGVLQEK